MKIRPYIRKFHSSEYINALANGDICLALGWSGDMLQARDRATEAKNGVDDRLLDPEGRRADVVRHDGHPRRCAACRRSPRLPQLHDEAGSRGARHSNFVFYANGNKASQQFIDKAVIDDPAIYPDAATLQKLFTVAAVRPQDAARRVRGSGPRSSTGQ